MLTYIRCIIFLVRHKRNSVPLGPMQPPSFPSTKQLHGKLHLSLCGKSDNCSMIVNYDNCNEPTGVLS